MDIQSVTNTTTTLAQAKAGSSNGLSSDFQTFLRMLTAQMQNQDPLNPLEASDFAVQLATFSGVEQQVRTNDLLEKMAGQSGVNGLSQLANLIGNEVRSPALIAYDGTPVDVWFTLPTGAQNAELVVRDPSGTELSRMAVTESASGIPWADGGLPAGNYELSIEVPKTDGSVTVVPVESYAQVVEARLSNGAAVLVLQDGSEIAADKVTGFRLH